MAVASITTEAKTLTVYSRGTLLENAERKIDGFDTHNSKNLLMTVLYKAEIRSNDPTKSARRGYRAFKSVDKVLTYLFDHGWKAELEGYGNQMVGKYCDFYELTHKNFKPYNPEGTHWLCARTNKDKLVRQQSTSTFVEYLCQLVLNTPK